MPGDLVAVVVVAVVVVVVVGVLVLIVFLRLKTDTHDCFRMRIYLVPCHRAVCWGRWIPIHATTLLDPRGAFKLHAFPVKHWDNATLHGVVVLAISRRLYMHVCACVHVHEHISRLGDCLGTVRVSDCAGRARDSVAGATTQRQHLRNDCNAEHVC